MIHRLSLSLEIPCLVILASVLVGCDGKPSRTTMTESTAFATLEEKQAFLEKYVTFRRTYETLDFWIHYRDGGEGRLPGPTEWDVRIVARVPEEELEAWTDGLETVEPADGDWLSVIPNAPARLDGFEWFGDGRRWVGLHRGKRLIIYRNLAI